MTVKKTDYELLGVTENSTKDEIHHRYSIIVKQKKYNEDLDISEISDAYNRLMGYDTSDLFTPDYLPDEKILGINKNKGQNFWRYNRLLILAIVLVAVALAISIRSCATREPIGLYIVSAGNIYTDNQGQLFVETLEEKIESNSNVVFEELIFSNGNTVSSTISIASRMKLVNIISSKKVDVILFDIETFNQYASMGVLLSLDELVDDDTEEVYRASNEGETQEHIYGFNVYNSTLMAKFEAPINKEGNGEIIFAICLNAPNMDNALELAEIIKE